MCCAPLVGRNLIRAHVAQTHEGVEVCVGFDAQRWMRHARILLLLAGLPAYPPFRCHHSKVAAPRSHAQNVT